MEGYAQPHGAEAAEMHSDLCICVALPGMAGYIFCVQYVTLQQINYTNKVFTPHRSAGKK